MTQDEVIQIAKQAGFTRINQDSPVVCGLALFERFANLVAAKEREACAVVCDEEAKQNQRMFPRDESLGIAATECAESIRARGQA